MAKKAGLTVLIFCLATLLSLGLWESQMRAENMIMMYLLSVIVVIIETRGFWWGAGYAAVCVVAFNFLFTEPRFTLHVSDPNYVVMMVSFMAVSAITSLLVYRWAEQVRIARENENRMQALLEISSGYLTLSGTENIVYYGIKSLYQAAGERCVVYLAKDSEDLGAPYYIKSQFEDPGILDNDTPAHWCFLNNTSCGAGTGFFGDSGWVYLPVRNGDACLGVIGVYTGGKEIDGSHMVFINTVLSEMAMAIAKERVEGRSRRAEQTGDAAAREAQRLLLYDFCRPFEELLEELKTLGTADESGRCGEFLARYRTLSNRVRNVVRLCQLSAPEAERLRQEEELSGIVEEALAGRSEEERARFVWLRRPAEPIRVLANRPLAVQAAANVLDNALVHTPAGSRIYLSVSRDKGYGTFEVADTGEGISFSQVRDKLSGETSGGALRGLSVSLEMMRRQRGGLSVRGSRYGGTCVTLSLPLAFDRTADSGYSYSQEERHAKKKTCDDLREGRDE